MGRLMFLAWEWAVHKAVHKMGSSPSATHLLGMKLYRLVIPFSYTVWRLISECSILTTTHTF